MAIKLPENPNLYFILIGLVLIIFVVEFYEGDFWIGLITIIIGFFLLLIGLFGLQKTNDLKDEKMQIEINLMQQQINNMGTEPLFRRH